MIRAFVLLVSLVLMLASDTVASSSDTISSLEPADTLSIASDVSVDVDASPEGEPSPAESETEPMPNTVAETDSELVCRNSFDERCGDFRWDPEPDPDQPLHADLSFSPANPKPGDVVTFTVTLTDPDAAIEYLSMSFGDERVYLIPPVRFVRRFGPWTPPDKQPGYLQRTLTNAYRDAGTYTVRLWADSGFLDANPYGDQVGKTLTLVVEGEPSPTADESPSPNAEPTAEASPSPAPIDGPTDSPSPEPSESPDPATGSAA